MIGSRRIAYICMASMIALWPGVTSQVDVAEPVLETNQTVVQLETVADRNLIERVCYAEAGGEPDPVTAQMAVANVILDRMTLWGKSAEEVLTAPKQFAKPSTIETVPPETKEAVSRVFDKGERIFAEPTTHFFNPTMCDPVWAKTKINRGEIGNHRFMY